MNDDKKILVAELFDEAAKEVDYEALEVAKCRIETKLTQLRQAKRVVANIERELVDLRHELEETL